MNFAFLDMRLQVFIIAGKAEFVIAVLKGVQLFEVLTANWALKLGDRSAWVESFLGLHIRLEQRFLFG